jgi:hypothetical protein
VDLKIQERVQNYELQRIMKGEEYKQRNSNKSKLNYNTPYTHDEVDYYDRIYSNFKHIKSIIPLQQQQHQFRQNRRFSGVIIEEKIDTSQKLIFELQDHPNKSFFNTNFPIVSNSINSIKQKNYKSPINYSIQQDSIGKEKSSRRFSVPPENKQNLVINDFSFANNNVMHNSQVNNSSSLSPTFYVDKFLYDDEKHNSDEDDSVENKLSNDVSFSLLPTIIPNTNFINDNHNDYSSKDIYNSYVPFGKSLFSFSNDFSYNNKNESKQTDNNFSLSKFQRSTSLHVSILKNWIEKSKLHHQFHMHLLNSMNRNGALQIKKESEIFKKRFEEEGNRSFLHVHTKKGIVEITPMQALDLPETSKPLFVRISYGDEVYNFIALNIINCYKLIIFFFFFFFI